MRLALVTLSMTFLVATHGFAQIQGSPLEKHFNGPVAREALCSFLLDARQRAEIEGRLDFAATVASAGRDTTPILTARVSSGSPYAIRRIHFTGHRNLNDTTLRRSLTTFEREMLNIQQLRRGLTRINALGVFQPLTLDDVVVTRLDDGTTVDLTIQLRERKPRWWSISGVLVPFSNPLKATLASRLPSWGRGPFEMATYFVSLNAIGFGRPFFALERTLIPGQEWLSGFAITPSLSPRTTAAHYARSHAVHAVSRMLEFDADDAIAIDINSADGSKRPPLVCKPPKPRMWLLRTAARQLLPLF